MPRGRRNPESLPVPFLKWAGGKTQLLPQLEPLYPAPEGVRRYIEPFVGSAAVFFHVRSLLRPGQVILSDNNEELIHVYRAVRDDVKSLIRRLSRHKAAHSREHYYAVRRENPARMPPSSRAARLIYLNKTCFNGLYRVNSRGEFNVPMGRYSDPPILDARNLRAVSAALRGVDLRVAHFSEVLEFARAGDFIYFDPPYHPLSATSYFTAYTKGSFGEADQRELARVYRELDRRGCLVMLSNSAAPLIEKLYKGFDVRKVYARRSINSNATRRGQIQEVVVLNYVPGLAIRSRMPAGRHGSERTLDRIPRELARTIRK
jgi:DNA adenine methylase